MIKNPVLEGFHPDPSIVRVENDYYLATSSFEWFPGVSLYHSRDLVHWRAIGHALTRTSQLDLRGVPDSGGVWAPSLSHADGRYWLVYTVMHTRTGPYKDMINLLITANSIDGPWSDPVYLNSRGFDPSLFHDDDGRKWLVQIVWDHRKQHPSFGGIVVQELNPKSLRLEGKCKVIHKKNCLIEGPNLYKKGGFYYLLLAQGGTSWNHAVSVARARHIFGPYEDDPQDVVLTSAGHPDLPLQKAGHGELVETPFGEWYLAHLASRPLLTPQGPRCPMGRETCIQKVELSKEGWFRLSQGGTSPSLEVKSPYQVQNAFGSLPTLSESFDPQNLGPAWLSLRGPITQDWADGSARHEWMRLRGRDSLASLHNQSLIARRVTSTAFHAEVLLDFIPESFAQMAGLVCYYDTKTHLYLRVTRGDSGERVLGIVCLRDGTYDELGDVVIAPTGEVLLGVDWSGSILQFSFMQEEGPWQKIGPELDASVLSDDFGAGLHFTGAFVGIASQDLDRHSAFSYFKNFKYI